jgi:hypothetical protein
VRIAAADRVFDRTVGRPTARTEHTGKIEVDIPALRAKLDSLMEQRARHAA